MGPTNTQPRYRPPPPGAAPPAPPPVPGSEQNGAGGGHAYGQPPMGGAAHSGVASQGYLSSHQQYGNQQYQQPQYGQQQRLQAPAPSRTAIPGSSQSYAARSAASQMQQQVQPAPSHGGPAGPGSAHGSFHGGGSSHSLPPPPPHPAPTPVTATDHRAAEQARLLHASTARVTEHAYHMARAMESDDVVPCLESATRLLEELGDPNHGVRGQGGTGNRNGAGGGVVGGGPGPPGYHGGSTAGGVPPLGNYGDRYAPSSGGSNNSNGLVTPLSPRNYYELHMRAMDEMPALEEFLLGLCRTAAGADGSHGATNASSLTNSPGVGAYGSDELYEAVQYTPRVVPRIYLQICVGAVSIRTGDRRAVRVMDELGVAARMVQCPVRGLFLRYYLLMALKDKLPDGPGDAGTGEEEEAAEGAEENPLSPVSQERADGDGPTTPMPGAPPPLPPPPPPPVTTSIADDSPLFDTGGGPASDSLFGDASPGGPSAATATAADSLFGEAQPTANGDSLFGSAPIEPPPPPPAPAESAPLPPSAEQPPAPEAAQRDPDAEGTVADSVEFILSNLLEMNRLWIRIAHLPGPRDRESRRRVQRERQDLRILVGSNLNRLSSLEGVTARVYGSSVLPRILGEVAGCRDPLSQAYLMDCVIQTFPDEYHLETLEVFLGVLPKLREKVNVRTILSNMMDRLVHYCEDDRIGDASDADASGVKSALAAQSFEMFEDIIGRVCEARGARIPPRDVVRLQLCLLGYAVRISSDSGLVARCIGNCAAALGTLQAAKAASVRGQGIVMGGGTASSSAIDMDDKATGALEEMLKVPLSAIGLDVLGMPDFAALLGFLPWENRRAVATELVRSLLESGRRVGGVHELEGLFGVISPLLRDEGVSGPAPSYHAQVDGGAGGGGGLISRTANLMGTLGIHADDHGDDVFGRPDHMAFAHDDLGVYHHGGMGGGGADENTARFREEQSLVARLIHLLGHDDTDVAYQLLVSARRHVQHGGGGRARVTVPAVVFEALGLLRRVQALEFPGPPPEPAEPELSERSEEGPASEDSGEKDTPEEKGEKGGDDEPEDGRPEAETAEESKDSASGDETETGEEKAPEGAAADASAGGSSEAEASPEPDAKAAGTEGEGSEAEIPKDEPAVAPPPVPEPGLFVAEFTKSVK